MGELPPTQVIGPKGLCRARTHHPQCSHPKKVPASKIGCREPSKGGTTTLAKGGDHNPGKRGTMTPSKGGAHNRGKTGYTRPWQRGGTITLAKGVHTTLAKRETTTPANGGYHDPSNGIAAALRALQPLPHLPCKMAPAAEPAHAGLGAAGTAPGGAEG